MEGIDLQKLLLTIFSGANLPLMAGVAVLAGVLRWAKLIRKQFAVIVPMVVGAGLGGLIAYYKPLPDGVVFPEMLASAFIFNGVAATIVARLAYPLVSKLFASTDDPPDVEPKPEPPPKGGRL